MNFKEEFMEKVAHVEDIIKEYLPIEEGFEKTILEAMNYSVLSGGKRLRPMLMEETCTFFGGQVTFLYPFMAAIEMIHTYSLVHDDLPAMDNDEYRRGRKTTHVVYGEGMAILAGDGLLNYAFETAFKAFEEEIDQKIVVKAIKVLSTKAGVYGMIGGQTADLEAEDMGELVSLEQLLYIHEHKTAALIQAAMMIGAIFAGVDEEQINVVEKIGYNIGVAFQIQDDILDVTSSYEVLGKPIGSDEKNHKTTYVTLLGLEKSKKEVEDLSTEAITLLHSLKGNNAFLEELLESLVNRIN
jgi:geranylgeranyl diphosphate synthase, type II